MLTLKLITLDKFEELLPVKKQINAQYDDNSIIVYQAFKDKIADFAVANQYLGGSFQDDRMTWIKPNFLWIMHRSNWANKVNQERILAIRIKRDFFDELLENSVLSSFNQQIYSDHNEWKEAVKTSNVQVQWDPGYDIHDERTDFRVIQIGLKREMALRYSKREIIEIIDITEFVHEQYAG